jgi:hypothetical protein
VPSWTNLYELIQTLGLDAAILKSNEGRPELLEDL